MTVLEVNDASLASYALARKIHHMSPPYFRDDYPHCMNKLQIFSWCQKGFVQGQADCMEHAVLTMEMISHATMHRKDMYMVQIDFSNAFRSVRHELILSNVTAFGLPVTTVELVRNIYTDNRSKITLTS